MIPISLTFVITALWLILSPWNLEVTLCIIAASLIILTSYTLYSYIKSQYLRSTTSLFMSIGILISTFLYLPALKNYQTISLNIPHTISATFQIERNQYPTSTTIQIISSKPVANIAEVPLEFYEALRGSTIRIYNIDPKIKSHFMEGEVYQSAISLRPRYFRNIPGDQQRIYQALARKEIGYGKFESPPQKISDKSMIENFRQRTATHFIQQFQHGSYLSALSVGITQYLTADDWDVLRQTGTIHLVSISGLHLSLTAFYAFIIFRIAAGLLAIRRISPYKIAAFFSIIVAWNYALIAGLSLPTVRAAIMFSLAMLALLINRPIFSLHGVSIALIINLIHNPLSILLPGFWLSFVAVIILILSARIFSNPLKALLLTQLIISLILIPLTASFFGEVSIISPLVNLFAIPWTSLMIMPPLLIGTLLLFIHEPSALLFNAIANQSIDVLTRIIQWSAQIPYASIETSRLPLIIAVTITFGTLLILYIIPRIVFFKTDHPRIYSGVLYAYQRLSYSLKPRILITILTLSSVSIFYFKPLLLPKNKISKTESINLYLLPVGEGLSLLFQSPELTFLFDTGNRFMRFDAGKQIILPTLQHLNIQTLDQIFLSLQNQQHIGGTRSIRTKLPETTITAHPDLLWLINQAQDCRQYHYQSKAINIHPISQIKSSCAFHVVLFETISLYLLSDITEQEWQNFLKGNIDTADTSKANHTTHKIFLFPNQGRRLFSLPSSFLSTKVSNTLLFSTKNPSQELLEAFQNHTTINAYNAYYGTIHLSINAKNAKPFSKLRIKNYADHARYWWLQP